MKTSNRRLDPAQQKAKKQKVIVAVGAVILLALIGFELPKVMSHGKSPSTAAPPAATTTGSTDAPASGAEPAAAAAAPSLAAAPVAPLKLSSQSGATASDGQLVMFTFMKSKDPFRQQLTEAETTATGPTTPPASAPPASASPTSTSSSYTPPASSPPSSTPPSSTTEPTATTTEPTATTPTSTEPTATAPPPTSTEPSPAPPPSTVPSTPPTATETGPTPTPPPGSTPEPTPAKPPVPTVASLSVNGVVEKVKVDGSFPAAQPLFQLVSLKDGVARIGIAGGTLEGSSQTVALPVGKSVTLMNTADGMRYVVKLVSVS